MKSRRDICYSKDAGSIQYPGLPGHIKTGCIASPSFKSRFCSSHDVHSCSPADSSCTFSNTDGTDGIVEMLLAVKETRGSKYYQVSEQQFSNPDLTLLFFIFVIVVFGFLSRFSGWEDQK